MGPRRARHLRHRSRPDVGEGRPGGVRPRDRRDVAARRHRSWLRPAGRRRRHSPRTDHHRARRRAISRDECPDRQDAWAATLSRLAEIQRVVAAEPRALAIAGVAPVLDPYPGRCRSAPDGRRRRVGDREPEGLDRAEAAALRARIPILVDACHELADSGVPDSLEHGDLTADEVILGEMGPVFLDWSDGSITHPFLSAASLLADGRRGRRMDRVARISDRGWRPGSSPRLPAAAALANARDRPAAPPGRPLRRPDPARVGWRRADRPQGHSARSGRS